MSISPEEACKLSPSEKRALLAELLRKRAAEPKAYPLSYAQERLWFLDQLGPGSPLYNVPLAVSLPGVVDLEALRAALQEMVRRHEVLRTRFVVRDGRPVQLVEAGLEVQLPVRDLSAVPEPERQREAQRIAAEEAVRPFDLAAGPLFRASLVRLSGAEHALVLTFHHIVSDAWSMGVFLRELAAFYDACRTGRPAGLPALPIQYADFAAWQREWLTGSVLEEQLAYWRARLEGAPALLELPADRPRPKTQSFAGAAHAFRLQPRLAQALSALARSEGSTLFMCLLGCFLVLIHRYSGQRDLVVGSPIANRNRAELEGLIGFFVNTLALRTDLSGDPTFRELLGRVREVTLGAYAHQDLPFEKLVEELQPERSLAHNPLFQVMFTLQNAPGQGMPAAPGQEGPAQLGNGTAKFDLSLLMAEAGDELIGVFEYTTDLFEPARIHRMAKHFETLIEGITADPDRPLSELPLLTATEWQELVVEANQTTAPYPDRCVHELFEERAARQPEATAVLSGGRQFTYGELNTRANRLAHELRARGTGPQSVIAICLERSFDMIVAVLGTLKAGAAYLPIDPAYPDERIAFMLADSAAPVLVSSERLIRQLPAPAGQVLCLDRDAELLQNHSDGNPPSRALLDDLAYVIYTSGSTGQPKGVAIPHRGLTNLLDWESRNVAPAPGMRTLQFAALGFDVSFQEIFTTLCAGAALVLVDEYHRRDPSALLELLADATVDCLFVPYVMLQQLASSPHETMLTPHLKRVTTAGEQLHLTPRIEAFLSRMRGCPLYNQYGPTETHVVTELVLTGAPQKWPRLPPIGRPIQNIQVFVLDEHLKPVPAGVPGELCIGGVGLARGYLNRPALTAERFVPHPFSRIPGARLYRTGDLARLRPDATIEFLGRMDEQVKVRGFRIEPGEIEAALADHPAVAEAAVLAREDAGDRRLVAYLVPASGRSAPLGELRALLKAKLPAHMIPQTFVMLERLPLSPNGKLDRRALPVPDSSRPELEKSYVPPRTETESALCAIWGQVLGIEKVGVEDNFFELGGHSLLATQVISRIRNVFQVELPLRRLFETPTVAEIASTIVQEVIDRLLSSEDATLLDEVELLTDKDAKALLDEELRRFMEER